MPYQETIFPFDPSFVSTFSHLFGQLVSSLGFRAVDCDLLLFFRKALTVSVTLAVIAHAPLASALKRCAQHVYACDSRVQDRILAFDIEADADMDAISSMISARLPNQGAKTLILTDIVGASPSNIAHRMLIHANTAVITGVNLAMVLTALCHDDAELPELIELVKNAGTTSIADKTAL